jgi:hypothetical protein
LAHQALVMALHGGGQLAFTFCSGLLVKFAGTQIGQQTGLFHGTLETAHRDFKRLIFFNTYSCHEQTTFYKKFEGAILAKQPGAHNPNLPDRDPGEFALADLRHDHRTRFDRD